MYTFGCKYLATQEPPTIIPDTCSEYGCGAGGVCDEISESEGKFCSCESGYIGDYFYPSINYCVAKPKQLILNENKNNQVLLSNYGYDIPKEIDKENKFLYYSDSARVYDGFYLMDDKQTLKLSDGKKIYFDEKIKDIVYNNYDSEKVVLLENKLVQIYDNNFQNKLFEFSGGEDEIVKISPNSYITKSNKFFLYKLSEVDTNYELTTEYIEGLSPALDLSNNNCSLMNDNKVIKCVKKYSGENKISSPYNFEYDEEVLFVKDNCIYTNKNKLFCIVGVKVKFKENVYIDTINKDFLGSNSKEFCYLSNYLNINCINYSSMDLLEN